MGAAQGAPSGSTPPTGGTPSLCPHCGAPLPAGTRFCGQCGAAVGAPSPVPSPAPSPAAPVDLRQKIDGDRGGLKKLQLLIPGFRGYRIGEDLRDADSILRREVADLVLASLTELTGVRQSLVQANQYGSLNDIALAVSDLTVLEGTIRHGAQGYSGISATVRVQPMDLERLYEYDYGFVLAARQLRGSMDPLTAAARANDPARLSAEVGRVRGLVAELKQAFQARLHTVEGIQV